MIHNSFLTLCFVPVTSPSGSVVPSPLSLRQPGRRPVPALQPPLQGGSPQPLHVICGERARPSLGDGGEHAGGGRGDRGGRAGLTLVAVRQEVGARAQVVVVEAVDGHGGVLTHATPEPAHGGGRRATSAMRPHLLGSTSQSRDGSTSCQPIRRAAQRRERLLKWAGAGGCLATVGGGDGWSCGERSAAPPGLGRGAVLRPWHPGGSRNGLGSRAGAVAVRPQRWLRPGPRHLPEQLGDRRRSSGGVSGSLWESRTGSSGTPLGPRISPSRGPGASAGAAGRRCCSPVGRLIQYRSRACVAGVAGHTGCRRWSVACNCSCLQDSDQANATSPFPPRAGGEDSSAVQARTRHSLGSQAHMHSWIPRAPVQPL